MSLDIPQLFVRYCRALKARPSDPGVLDAMRSSSSDLPGSELDPVDYLDRMLRAFEQSPIIRRTGRGKFVVAVPGVGEALWMRFRQEVVLEAVAFKLELNGIEVLNVQAVATTSDAHPAHPSSVISIAVSADEGMCVLFDLPIQWDGRTGGKAVRALSAESLANLEEERREAERRSSEAAERAAQRAEHLCKYEE